MHKAGGIISIIAGVFGIFAAIFTLFFGGLAGALKADGAGTVVGLGWGGLLASFLVIIFGAVALAKPKGAGIALIVCSIAGMVGGGTFVAVCLALSLIGGILCVVGAKSVPVASAAAHAMDVPIAAPASGEALQPWSNGRMVLYGTFSFFAPLIGLIAGIIGLTKAHTRKQGVILLGLTLAGTVMYAAISKGMKSDSAAQGTSIQSSSKEPSDKFADLAAATPTSIKPTGELAAMFGLMSDNTDLQREDKIKDLKGKVVEWNLTVFEVARDGDGYKVQTAGDDEVGTFVYLAARDESEKKRIEALKTGDRISVKGVIKDTFMRSFAIKPAILSDSASRPGAATQAAATTSDWPPVNVTALVGKSAGHIFSDPTERGRFSKLVGSNAELDDYLTTTIFDDESASEIQNQGEYLVIVSKGVMRRDTGPMDGAYAIHKSSGKPVAILLKDGEFTLLGANAQSLPPPLRKWAKDNGAAL